MHRLPPPIAQVATALLFVAACASGCEDAGERGTPEQSDVRDRSSCKFKGRVIKDATLFKRCSPYEIKGGVDVLANATLTIEPGVEVRFRDGDWLEISAAGQAGGRHCTADA